MAHPDMKAYAVVLFLENGHIEGFYGPFSDRKTAEDWAKQCRHEFPAEVIVLWRPE